MPGDSCSSRPGVPADEGPPPRAATAKPDEPSAAEDAGLPISAAAARTGIPADTLRVWQRRYGLGASRQSAGGHRRYTRGDLERLREVQRLLDQGAPIGEAARSVLRAGSLDLPLPEGAISVARRVAAAAADLDGPAVRTLLRDQVTARGVMSTWEEVLRPVLAAIGERWSSLPHGVAVEHLLSRSASLTFEEAMFEMTGTDRSAPQVLLTCVPGERHDLPLVALGAGLAERGIPALLVPTRATIADITDEALRYSALTVLYSHDVDGRWVSAPRIWPTEAPLLTAGPGWDLGQLPAGADHTNDLVDAVRKITARIRGRVS